MDFASSSRAIENRTRWKRLLLNTDSQESRTNGVMTLNACLMMF